VSLSKGVVPGDLDREDLERAVSKLCCSAAEPEWRSRSDIKNQLLKEPVEWHPESISKQRNLLGGTCYPENLIKA
jgi:hypothetical protein